MCPKDSWDDGCSWTCLGHHREDDPLCTDLAKGPIIVNVQRRKRTRKQRGWGGGMAGRKILTCVHGDATDRWSNVEPATSPCLSKLSVLVVRVAGNADCCTSVLADPADLAALQPDGDILASHDFRSIISRLFFFGDDNGMGSCTAAKDSGTFGPRSNIENNRPNRDHMHWKAIAPPRSFGSQDTRVNDSSHTV